MKGTIKDVIYNYPTKNEHGFTTEEIKKLLKLFGGISVRKFNKKLGIHTAMLIDGEIITYHCDVLMAIRCCLENREQTFAEFD